MRKRLDDLLSSDTTARWRIISTSAVITSLLGIGSELAHKSVNDAQIIATSVGALAFLGQVLLYCTHSTASDAAIERTPVISRRFAIATGLILFFGLVPVPFVEARVITRRLLRVTKNGSVSAGDVGELTRTLEVAEMKPLKLPVSVLGRVRDSIAATGLARPNSPAVIGAAKALNSYSGAIRRQSVFGQTPPVLANNRGTSYVQKALSSYSPRDSRFAEMLKSAVEQYDQAILLAGSDDQLKAYIFLQRASCYSLLNEYDESLEDIGKAKSLGACDLSVIIPVEAAALIGKGDPADLKRALDLLTFALQLVPVFPASTPAIDHYGVLGLRQLANYKLGNYRQVISDADEDIRMAGAYSRDAFGFYRNQIYSYLHLGDVAAALEVTTKLGRIDSKRAAVVRDILIADSDNPQVAIRELKQAPLAEPYLGFAYSVTYRQ